MTKNNLNHPRIRETLSIKRNISLSSSILIIIMLSIQIGLTFVIIDSRTLSSDLPREILSTFSRNNTILIFITITLMIHSCMSLWLLRRVLLHVAGVVKERDNELQLVQAMEGKLQSEIEERKIAELELANSQQRVISTLKSLGIATIVVDLKGSIDFANPAAEILLGLPSEKITGNQFKRIYEILDSSTREKITPPLKEVLNTGEKQSSGTHLVLVRKDNKEIIVSDSITPLNDKKGDIQGFVVVIQDLSQHQQLEEQLRESHKMEAVGQLSAGIAAEFNNLTSNILMVANLLDSKIETASPDKKYVNNLLETANKAQDLSRQLASFSQRKPEEFVNLDIHRIINNVADILRHSVDKRIDVILECDAQNSMTTGNPNHLQSTILELCVIAKQAVHDKGEIFISSRELDLDCDFCRNAWTPVTPGPHIQITISDNGTGLNNAEKESAIECLSEGSLDSVGLSLIRSTMEMHHGTCFIYSEKNVGTVYNIFLPLIEDKNKKEKASPKLQSGEGRILVVDDEELLRELLNNSLSDLGYNVELAENGRIGVDTYRENKENIDLIIMDMVMPVMNGREALEEILKIDPQAKVIIASGFSRNEDIQACIEMGIASYVQKPYVLTDLTEKIRQAIQN